MSLLLEKGADANRLTGLLVRRAQLHLQAQGTCGNDSNALLHPGGPLDLPSAGFWLRNLHAVVCWRGVPGHAGRHVIRMGHPMLRGDQTNAFTRLALGKDERNILHALVDHKMLMVEGERVGLMCQNEELAEGFVQNGCVLNETECPPVAWAISCKKA